MPSSYTEHFWREKGAACARRGFAPNTAYINDANVNAVILAGYDAERVTMAAVGERGVRAAEAQAAEARDGGMKMHKQETARANTLFSKVRP
jgi:hypothetical protein